MRLLAIQSHRARWERRWDRWKQAFPRFVPLNLSWFGALAAVLAGMVRELKQDIGSALLRAMPHASVVREARLGRSRRSSGRKAGNYTALYSEPLEERRMLTVATAWVNDVWIDGNGGALLIGDPVSTADQDDIGPVSGTYGVDAFSSVSTALPNVSSGGTIKVLNGNYTESTGISITQSVDIEGYGTAHINASAAPTGIAISGGAQVSLDHLRITSGSVFGIQVFGAGTNATISNSEVLGSATVAAGVTISSGNVTITDSILTGSQRGLLASGTATASVTGSNLAGNSLRGLENATSPQVLVDASGNWWGSAAEASVSAQSLGQVDFTPFLADGTDLNGATVGFAGDTSEVYVSNQGGQAGSTARVQEGINVADAGGTLNVIANASAYDGIIVVDKALLLQSTTGDGLATASVHGAKLTSTTGASSKVLVEVRADDVTIKDFRITVDRAHAVGGIVASNVAIPSVGVIGGSFDDLTIDGNLVESVGENIGAFVLPGGLAASAMGIVAHGQGGPVHDVTIVRNEVLTTPTATLGPFAPFSLFTRGLYLGAVKATVGGVGLGNTLQGVAQDLLVQFASGGTTRIEENVFNAGGVDASGSNSGSPIEIVNNQFNIASPLAPQSLLIRGQHDPSSTVTASGNTFLGHTTGVVVDNSSAVVIDDNDFTPAPTATNYTHIALDTNRFNSAGVGPLQSVGATITSNTFFGNANTGTAISLSDSNNVLTSASPDFAGVVIGGSGDENVFKANVSRFIALNPAGVGGPVSVDLDASENVFGVTSAPSGEYAPTSMTTDQLFEVEDKIVHEVDVDTLGFVTVLPNNVYVTANSYLAPFTTAASVQRGINAAGAHSNTVHVNAGTYSGAITINKDIDVVGYGTPTLQPGAAASNFVEISGSGYGGDATVRLDGFSFNGLAGLADRGVRVLGSASFNLLDVKNSSFTGFDFNAIYVGDNIGTALADVHLTDLVFTNNGIAGGGGTADIQFFGYNADATLTNLTLSSSISGGIQSGIQFRGVGNPDGTGVMSMGDINFSNVDISGKYVRQFIGIQRYQNPDLSFNNVKLGSATSEITGTFGAGLRFDAVGFGTLASPSSVDLGNTLFRGLAPASAQRHEIEIAPDNSHTFLRVDADSTSWKIGGVDIAAASLSLTQAFAVEDRILHYVDKLHPTHGTYKGFVDVQPGQAFITDSPESGLVGEGSINRGIAIVTNGGTVNVASGTYDQSVSGAANNIVLATGSSPGQVTLNGNLALDANDTLQIEINGTNAATQYDNLIVNGTVTLGGATLSATRGFNPAYGDTFTIINNDGVDSILPDTFAGYPEGSIVTIDNVPFVISYAGGVNNNDVTLTVTQPTTVWVNDTWVIVPPDLSPAGLSYGDEVDSDGVNDDPVSGKIFGYNAFSSIQDAVNAVAIGGTIIVLAGDYHEDVLVNKTVSMLGQGISGTDQTTVSGVIGGDGATIRIAASNVLVDGFYVTRDGNNLVDWYNPGLNSAGIAIQGLSVSGTEIRNNQFEGNRTAIDLNNVNGHWVHNNVIENNRTGLVLRNEVSNTTIEKNSIADNWTVGVVWLPGTTATAAGTKITNNAIHGNWWGGVVNRTSGGGEGIKDFSGNWFGTNAPVFSTLNSGEPGYSDLGTAANIPNTFGGTATAPGSQPDILDPGGLGTLLDYTPWLDTGANSATIGFDGDFSYLHVSAASAQKGSVGRIQEGINLLEDGAETAGDRVVDVKAGTYVEQIDVNKAATLLGAQSTNDARSRSMVPETIILPDVSGPDPNTAPYPTLMYVSVGDVTIDGFTFDGDNPNLTSGVIFNGADIDAEQAIVSYEGVSDINVVNNIVRNLSYSGIEFYNYYNSGGATSNNVISQNLIENLGGFDWGIGVLIYNNFYADVTDNLIRNVRTGIQTGNFSQANPGSTQSISTNEIEARRVGIFNNLHYSAASTFTISANEISAVNDAAATRWFGMLISSQQSAVDTNITGNLIDGSSANAATLTAGYTVWNTPTTADLTITGGTVEGVDYGVWVNNYEGYNSDADYTHVTVDGVDISADQIGVYVLDSPSNTNGSSVFATITGNTEITTGGLGTGIQVSGADADADVLDNNASIHGNLVGIDVIGGSATISGNHIYDNGIGVRFTGGGNGSLTNNNFDDTDDNDTDLVIATSAGTVLIGIDNDFAGDNFFIDNQSIQGYDLSSNGTTFDQVSNFRIEDRMFHKVDTGNTLAGLITWVAGNLYVTDAGTDHSIQLAINAASPNDTVNVEAGMFIEDVNINKAGLNLFGAGVGATTVSGPIGGGGATMAVQASNVEIAGFKITREGNTVALWNDPNLNTAGIAVQGLTITGLLVRDNYITGLRTGIDVNNSNGHTIRNNVIDYNRTGLIFRNQTDNLLVTENYITNNWTVGIVFLDASGGTNVPVQTALASTFSNNNISGNWYGQIVDRQTGGALPVPGANPKNFVGNWFGSNAPVVSTANSAEPGYAGQIPFPYDPMGPSTGPGGQPDVLGPASANFDITPWLQVGTDTNIDSGNGWGTYGFQGVTLDVVPPVITAGASSPANEASPITLTATATDVAPFDSGIASTLWELLSNPNGDVMVPDSNLVANFTPSDNGLYVFRFTATDNAGNVSSQIVNVNVNNLNPNATDDTNSANEDGPSVNGDVLTDGVDDSDPAGIVKDPLTVTQVKNASNVVVPFGIPTGLPSGAILTFNANGTYTYNPNGAFEYLAVSESTTDTFTYEISDGDGGLDTATVTITINGTNDTPVLSPVDVSGSITEGGVLSDNGSLNYSDVDQTDTATTSSAPVSAVWTGGVLSGPQLAALNAAFTILPPSFPSNAGVVTWDYTISEAALNFLSVGETVTLVFNVTVTDESLVSATQQVTIVINGTNDTPVLSPVDVSGSITEGGVLSDNGSLNYSDVDQTDTATTSSAPVSAVWTGGVLSGPQLAALNAAFTILPPSFPSNAGVVTWDYTISEAALNFLSVGETVTLVFNVTVTDESLVSATQQVTIVINGTNDTPVLSPVDVSGSITEGGVLSDNGSLNYSDVDQTDTATTSSAPVSAVWTGGVLSGPQLAALNAAFTILPPSFPSNAGVVTWDYTISEAALNFLSVGETVTLVFNVTVTDESLVSATQQVTIVINGTNDTPVLSPVDVSGSITEGGVLSDNGSLNYSDVDQTDTATTSSAPVSAVWTGGVLSGPQLAALNAAFTILPPSFPSNAGVVTWDYTISEAALNFLSVGETVTLVFNVTVTDESLVSATQQVTIVINGTNDTPVLSPVDVSGSITEGGVLSDNGSLNYSDVDQTDTATTSSAPVSAVWTGGVLSGPQLAALNAAFTILPPSFPSNAGVVTWDYTISEAALNFLSVGETVTLVFNVTVTDESLVSATQQVTIVINGTNDTPVLSPVDVSGSITEGGVLSDNGSLNYSDVDQTDTATTSSAPVSAVWTGGVLSGPQLAALNAAFTILPPSFPSNAGVVTWDYTISEAALNFLSVGETVTLVFNVTVTDESLVSATQQVTIVINGTNDAPFIASNNPLVTVNEGTPANNSGTFGDLDENATVILTASVGTVIDNGNGTWSWSFNSTDGPNQSQTVTIFANDGISPPVSTNFSLVVNNVTPTIALTGANTHNESATSPYGLTLGPITDPGTDTVISATVFWGDGSFTVLSPIQLAAVQLGTTVLNHIYDDNQLYTGPITVTLVDEDGTHALAGVKNLVVNNVAPTGVAINGGVVNEGSPGLVLVVGQFDPSATDTTAGFRYAYDFDNNGTWEVGNGTYAGSVVSDSAVVPGSFLNNGPSGYTVKARIIDKNGGFNDYTTIILVNNVAPVVNAGADTVAFGGTPFNRNVTFTDPGSEAFWTVQVDWNGDLVPDGAPFQVFTHNFNINHTYSVMEIGNTYTVTVWVNDGTVTSLDSFVVNVVEDTFRVTSFTTYASGFDVTFNRSPDLNDLNLYYGLPGGFDAADVTLVGTGVGAVKGSIVWKSATNTLSFVKTGGVLAADTYNVTLVSASTAFNDLFAALLDGDSNYIAGGNYTNSFVVAPSAARVVSLRDFARGPGQDVDDTPANPASNLAVRIDSAASVTALDFDVHFDPTLLNVSAATLASGLPLGWSITVNPISPGVIKVTASGATALSGSDVPVVLLTANVPNLAPYGNSQVIRLVNVRVNEDLIASKADYAVHKNAYLGDADGDGLHLGFDASLISRVVVNLDNGFGAHRWTDPLIVGDTTGDGTLSGLDASYVAQKAILLPRPEIPNIPGFAVVPGTPGIDPELSIPDNIVVTPGGSVTVPVNIDIEPLADVYSATFKVTYNTAVLDFDAAANGSFWTNGAGWSLFVNDTTPGELIVTMFNSSPSATGAGTILDLDFDVLLTAAWGSSPLDVVKIGPNEGNLTWSEDDGNVLVETSAVAGRHIFYNQSGWDGGSSAIDPVNDNLAIATDKTPYIPGSGLAIFNNITSFSRGINGIMIDLAANPSHAGITASDFIFKVGNDNSPAGWANAPAPSAISVIPGGGLGGSDRVTITWASGSIANKWLEVQVLPSINTGLALPDVFFWGNKIGDTGNFSTTTADSAQVFANLGGGKPITDTRDFNRDKSVTTADSVQVFANLGSIVMLNIPGGGPFAPEAVPTAAPAAAVDDGSTAVASALAAVAVADETTAPSTGGQACGLGSGGGSRASQSEHATVLAGSARVTARANAIAHDLSFDSDLLDYLIEDISGLVVSGKGRKAK